MKIYVVLVDYRSNRDTAIHGVYRQYEDALQEKQKLDISGKYWDEHQIQIHKVRIIDQEVTE